MKRRITALVLALVLTISLATGAAAAGSPFKDVSSEDWYSDYVTRAHAKGLIEGVSSTHFHPGETLSLAATAALAARVYQLYNNGSVTLKNGVGVWYSSYVDYAETRGILKAADYNSRWEQTATRRDFVAILYKTLPASEYTVINNVEDNMIPDVKITDPNGPEIYAFYRAGILTGSGDSHAFYPESGITRAEAAAVLVRLFEPVFRSSVTLTAPEPEPEPEPEPAPAPAPAPAPEPEPTPAPAPAPAETTAPSTATTTAAASAYVPAVYVYDHANEGTYLIQSASSGTVLGAATLVSGANIYLCSPSSEDVIPVSLVQAPGKDWYCFRVNGYNTMSLNQYGTAPKNGANVTLWSNSGSSSQGWYFRLTSGGYVIHSAYDDSLVLTEKNGNVLLRTYTEGDPHQLWILPLSSAKVSISKTSATTTMATPTSTGTTTSTSTSTTTTTAPATVASIAKSNLPTTAGAFTDTQMARIINAVGVQKGDSTKTSMCAAVTLCYINYWKTGVVLHPVDVGGTNAKWFLLGGQGNGFDSDQAVIARIKKELDRGAPCILHCFSPTGQHWVLFYRYTGAGDDMSDFWVADPWNGVCKPFADTVYTIHSDRRLVTF